MECVIPKVMVNRDPQKASQCGQWIRFICHAADAKAKAKPKAKAKHLWEDPENQEMTAWCTVSLRSVPVSISARLLYLSNLVASLLLSCMRLLALFEHIDSPERHWADSRNMDSWGPILRH